MNPSAGRRVVITGVGAVSAWGWGTEALWFGLTSGETAIRNFDRFDHTDYRTHVAAQVPAPPEGLPGSFRGWRRSCLADRYAVAATAEALREARLELAPPERDAAVVFGSSTGGMLETEEYYSRFVGATDGRASLGLLASQQVSAPGDAVAREFRVTRPVQTVSAACVSGASAIGLAFDAIRDGEEQVVIAGAADSLCRITYGGFNSLRSVDEQPCRSFRKGREGLSLGEGGAAVILESLDHALGREATPLAELVGFGSSNDAHHMTAPHPKGHGAYVALAGALREAKTSPESVDFVNAHGTGTPLNDVAEWEALREALGEHAARVPVTSTKGSAGHLLGAAGAIEAVATILCLRNEVVHPTPGPGEIDPEAPVNLVRNRPLSVSPMRSAVSLNLGFGGSNTALVFSSWDEA
jgi:3-oxoacyl-[acyl-carrier-protein] synthase II